MICKNFLFKFFEKEVQKLNLFFSFIFTKLEDHLEGILSQNDAKAYIQQIDDGIELFLQHVTFPMVSEDA
jgi:hypothetical protein